MHTERKADLPEPTSFPALEACRLLATGQITQQEFAEMGPRCSRVSSLPPESPPPWWMVLVGFAAWSAGVAGLLWWVAG
jgi:hypothetical protein